METYKLRRGNIADCARETRKVLKMNGVIIYPTDTLYGLGADALSKVAVEKIYEIKSREKRKPIHAIFADIEMVERYAEMNENARTLAKEFMPGPLTLILKKREGVETGIAHGIATIGIRIPDNEFCLALAREFDRPITATSANKSGENPLCSVKKICTQLGDAVKRIDLVIDGGELPTQLPSTVVDVSNTHPLILREGAILTEDIWNVLRKKL